MIFSNNMFIDLALDYVVCLRYKLIVNELLWKRWLLEQEH